MTTPLFIDRISKKASIQVLNTERTQAVNWSSVQISKQVQLTADAITEPDAGDVVLDNVNIMVHSTEALSKSLSFESTSTFKLINVTGGELYIDVPLEGNSQITISETPSIFVDTTPQVVYWS